MAIDHQQRPFGAMNYEQVSSYSQPPQFTNPWTSTSAAPPTSLYPPTHNMNSSYGLDSLKRDPVPSLSNHVSMSSYASMPHPTAPASSSSHMGSVYGQHDSMGMSQELVNQARMAPTSSAYGGSAPFTSSASAHSSYPTASPYDTMGYATAPMRSTYTMQPHPQADNSRRLSQPSVPSSSYLSSGADLQRHHRQNSLIDFSRGLNAESTREFGDAIDASRGMIAMSQNTTPRNIYGPNARNGRGSQDSYGFPATHSTSSSISSSSAYPSYFGGSVDSSVSDYSNTGSDIESAASRTLPRPSGFMTNGVPPAPSSMMSQFSSKVSSSAQKKHKCVVCDKRFTRPSSLQTHMYSHTGEKRKSLHKVPYNRVLLLT
jgi:hypothetical protein